MAAIGGSVESITLKGRPFAIAADAEVQRKIGGVENEVQPNGNGSGRLIQTRVPWMLGGVVAAVDDARGDQEFLQNLADGGEFFAVAITMASGKVYQGRGQISGELQYSTQNATASFDLAGPGILTPQ